MEAPTPAISKEPEKIQFQSEKIINKDNSNYKIIFGTYESEDNLVIKIIPEDTKNNFFYQSHFTLKELRKSSKIFKFYDTIKEIIIALPKMDCDILKKNEEILFILRAPSPTGEKLECQLGFQKYFIDPEKAIKDLSEENRSLKSNIKEKDKQIEDLKKSVIEHKNSIDMIESNKNIQMNNINQNIIFYQNENNQLQNKINILTQENMNLKQQNMMNIKSNQDNIYFKNMYEKLNSDYIKLKEEYEQLKIKCNILEEERRKNYVKIQGNDISKIISSTDEIQFIFNYIRKTDVNFKFNTIKLLYRGSKDGDEANKCHDKCDNKNNILIIIKSDRGNIFGGYSKIGFKTSNEAQYLIDNNCFLFSYDLKKIFPPVMNKKHICHINNHCGLCFNCSLGFYDNFMHSYDNIIYKDYIKDYFNGLDEPCEMNGGKDRFKCEELEVFQII